MNYVYSTLTNDMEYHIFKERHEDSNRHTDVHKKILVKGGANRARDEPRPVTPLGVVTAVSDEDLALLEKDPHFIQHQRNGFIVVDRKKQSVAKIVEKHMKAKDNSAPKVESDFPKDVKVSTK